MFIDYSDPSHVVITHRGTKLTGSISSDTDYGWWLHINVKTNYYPADILNVDYSKFIKNVLGYDKGNNSVKSKEDLIKVLDALNKEYDRQFGSEEYINIENCKNGDYLYIEDGKFKAIYIFRECQGNTIYRHAFYKCDCGYLDIDEGYLKINSTTKIRKATSNEIQTLNNALLIQKRLFWNPISKQLEKAESSAGVGVIDIAGVPAITNTAFNQKLVYKALEIEKCRVEQPLTTSETVSDISIKTFIKPKKHYKLNFNN